MNQSNSCSRINEYDSVKVLWNTKLKSRNSFLLILEMLNLPKPHYRGLLYSLVPSCGDAFYDDYVKKGYQFSSHPWPFFSTDTFVLNNKESIEKSL